jgi:hypothetical protein
VRFFTLSIDFLHGACKTLAAHGLEELFWTFFPVVLYVVSVFGSGGK